MVRRLLVFALSFLAARAEAIDVAVVEMGVVRVIAYQDGEVDTGSGFLISNAGHIVTNWHVVEGADRIEVHISGSSDRIDATIVRRSEDLDLAILRARGVEGTPLPLASRAPSKASKVYSFGFPGLADRLGRAVEATVTDGSVGRLFTGTWERRPLALLQHSAAINPGSSGGPLVDDCGRVVGVNTQGSTSSRIVRDAQGRVLDIVAGVGVNFAVGVQELNREIEALSIPVVLSDEPCSPGRGAQSVRNDETLRQARDAVDQAEAARMEAAELRERAEKLAARAERQAEHLLIASVLIGVTLAAGLFIAAAGPRRRIAGLFGSLTGPKRKESAPTPQASPCGLVLRAVDGERTLSLTQDAMRSEDGGVVGRDPNLSDAVLKSAEISRRHARLRFAEGALSVMDLNSQNNTLVNDQSIEPFTEKTLQQGDRVQFGDERYVVESISM